MKKFLLCFIITFSIILTSCSLVNDNTMNSQKETTSILINNNSSDNSSIDSGNLNNSLNYEMLQSTQVDIQKMRNILNNNKSMIIDFISMFVNESTIDAQNNACAPGKIKVILADITDDCIPELMYGMQENDYGGTYNMNVFALNESAESLDFVTYFSTSEETPLLTGKCYISEDGNKHYITYQMCGRYNDDYFAITDIWHDGISWVKLQYERSKFEIDKSYQEMNFPYTEVVVDISKIEQSISMCIDDYIEKNS